MGLKLVKGDLSKLSDKQLKAVELLAVNDINGYTQAQIAQEVDISPRQFRRWIADENMAACIRDARLARVADALPDVYSTLLRSAKNGSVKASELILKSFGLLTDNKRVEIEENGKDDRRLLQGEINNLMAELANNEALLGIGEGTEDEGN